MSETLNQVLMPTPTNLNAGQIKMVEGDVYNICQRIKEFDSSLTVVLHEGHDRPWVVIEKCPDGAERFVSRYKRLDGSIISDLQYMRAIPLEQRIAKLEREIEAENAKIGKIDEGAMDKFAWQFMKAARESNLMDPIWSKSFAKVKPKQRVNGD